MKKHTTLQDAVNAQVNELMMEADKDHLAFLAEARKLGKNYGQNNLPEVHEESFVSYIDGIVAHYVNVRTKMLVILSSSIQKIAGNIEIAAIDKKIAEQKDNIITMLKDLTNLKSDHSDIVIIRDIKSSRWAHGGLIFLAIGEAIFLASVCATIFVDSNIMAFVGAAFSFALVYIVKTTVLQFRDKSNNEISWIVRLGTPIFILCAIAIVGILRFLSVISSTGGMVMSNGYISNPVVYIVLSSLPLVCTAMATYRYALSEKDIQLLNKRHELQKEIALLEGKINDSKGAIIILEKEKNDSGMARLSRIHAQGVMGQKFDALYIEAVSQFKIENMRYRTTGMPISFKNTTPALPKIETDFFNTQNQI